MIWTEILRQFQTQGYKPAQPTKADAKDIEVCQRSKCPKCKVALEYKLFAKNVLFRAVSKCPKCTYANEF